MSRVSFDVIEDSTVAVGSLIYVNGDGEEWENRVDSGEPPPPEFFVLVPHVDKLFSIRVNPHDAPTIYKRLES